LREEEPPTITGHWLALQMTPVSLDADTSANVFCKQGDLTPLTHHLRRRSPSREKQKTLDRHERVPNHLSCHHPLDSIAADGSG
jgi:hypothetical protein